MKAPKDDKTQYRYVDATPSFHPGLTPTVRGHFENENYVFFWSGPFSNWDMGHFTHDGVTYNCSEQAMMYHKAMLFGDTETATKVLKTRDPRDQKKLGRAVKNFDRPMWEAYGVNEFAAVLASKFEQVPGYREILLNTGDRKIVEASPFDDVWGINMGVNHPDILDESKWRGKNLLGISLMKARDLVREAA